MRHRVCIGHRDARLDQAETGAALVIEHRDLAVQNRLRCLDVARQNAQLGILLIAALSGSRENAQLVVFDKADRAHAIPFHFVEPANRPKAGASRGWRAWGTTARGIGAFTAPAGIDRDWGLGVGDWLGRKVLGDFLLRAACEDAARVIFDVPAGLRLGVFLLDEQPFVALAASAHQHQREFAAQLFAMQAKFEIAALDLRQRRRVAQQFVAAAIPQHHAAAAVLALRNVAFKAAVVERMILHVHGQMFGQRLQARAFGNGPGFQGSVHFQAKIVVQPRGVVTLDAEVVARRRRLRGDAGLGSGVLSNDRLRLYSLSDIGGMLLSSRRFCSG